MHACPTQPQRVMETHLCMNAPHLMAKEDIEGMDTCAHACTTPPAPAPTHPCDGCTHCSSIIHYGESLPPAPFPTHHPLLHMYPPPLTVQATHITTTQACACVPGPLT